MTALSAREIDGEPIIRIAERLMSLYPPKTAKEQRIEQGYRLVLEGPGADRQDWMKRVRLLRLEMIAAGERPYMLPRRATYDLPHLQKLALAREQRSH